MVSLVKFLTDTGFDWNDKTSWGKHKPQISKDVTAGWGLSHIMLGPNNKVIKWLWMDSETLIWVSGKESLFRIVVRHRLCCSTCRSMTWRAPRGRLGISEGDEAQWRQLTEQASVFLSTSTVMALLLNPTHLLWSLDLLLLFKGFRLMVPESWTTVLESQLDFSKQEAYERCHWTPPQPGKYTILLARVSAMITSY